MPGFERSEIAGIASHIGVRESVRLERRLSTHRARRGYRSRFEENFALGCGPLDVHEEGGRLQLFMRPKPLPNPIALHDDEFGEEFARHRACDVRDAGSEQRNPSPGNSHGVGAGRDMP